MTSSPIAGEREAFEAHMLRLNVCTRLYRNSEAVGGEYRTVTVERAWQLWQAARAALLEPVWEGDDSYLLAVLQSHHSNNLSSADAIKVIRGLFAASPKSNGGMGSKGER